MGVQAGFQLEEWTVQPGQSRLVGPDGEAHLNPRVMDVLVYLAQHAGEVISREDFSRSVWSETVVTDDSLTWCISELRRQLGDQASSPRFIKTIPKRGYCLVATVKPLDEPIVPDEKDRAVSDRGETSGLAGFAGHRRVWSGIAGIAVLVMLAGWLLLTHREPATVPDPSIAVLPFERFSAADDSLFAEGLHHDLLTRLSQIEDLRVISKTSVNQYRDTLQPISKIADDLDVTWVLEGAVQQIGDEIQLNAQLIDAATDSHVWARTYRRTLTAENLFAIQAEIVDDIAASMQARLGPEVHDRIARTPTENLAAYERAIRGDALLSQRTESTMYRAAELYQEAIALDADYADAWAGLANAQMLLAYYGHAESDAALFQARSNALRALELTPDLALAHMVLGVVHMYLDQNGPAALKALEKAHTLSSDYVGWLAWMHAVAGNLPQALALTREQVRRSPKSPSINMSVAFLYLADHQPDTALQYARQAWELAPGYTLAGLLEGQALLIQGRYGQAVEALERTLDRSGTEPVTELLAWLAAAHAHTGDAARALALTDRIEAESDFFALGIARTGLGQFDAAVKALSQNGWNDRQTIMLRYHPIFDPLRDDQRFRAIIRSLDQLWGWSESPQPTG